MAARFVRRRTAALVAALTLSVPAACGGEPAQPTADQPSATPRATPRATPGPPAASPTTAAPAPGTVAPPWLGTRVLPTAANGFGEIRPTPVELRHRRFTLPDPVPSLGGTGFASDTVSPAPPDVLARSTWAPGCPVAAGDLAWVRVAFHGFDGSRHTGELLVNTRVAADLVTVFGRLWDAGFPMERLKITTVAERDALPTGDGNDTGAFNCRPTRGGTDFSQHAYGLAIDVNPFQNPYVRGDVVLPELASAYVDRGRPRAGMIVAGGPVVRAFASIGWEWGGSWRTLKDYQHFSANGR